MTGNDVLGRRALNRATLARQMLLRRAELSVPEAVEALVGLQAQTPHSWYVGLWTRLEGVEPEAVGKQLDERRLVRVALMRSTIHLVTAEDCLTLRPVVQPVTAPRSSSDSIVSSSPSAYAPAHSPTDDGIARRWWVYPGQSTR